jgi:hypothetical protein
MSVKSKGVRDIHAAEDKLSPFDQAMHVVSVTYSKHGKEERFYKVNFNARL